MTPKEQLDSFSPALCARFGLSRLAVFGSIARGESTESSDIDLLAEFKDPTPSTMPERYFGLIAEIEKQLHRKVQVVTPNSIKNPFFKRSMERDLKDLPQ